MQTDKDYTKCFVCGKSIEPFNWYPGLAVNCPRCGHYIASETFIIEVQSNIRFHETHLYIYSAACRELYDQGISPVNIKSVESLLASVVVPKNPLEKLDKLLLAIARNSALINEGVTIGDFWYPIAYLHDYGELEWLVLWAQKAGLIEQGAFGAQYILSMFGWQRVEELSKRQRDSTLAFVAMWFDASLDRMWSNGIKPALEAVGYEAVRVDTKPTNDKIDDKIIADIRKSSLVVADFTGHRGGVYFEAGFAYGLGIPVVFTCREDHMKEAHFDTRQYNHIVWIDDEDLKKKLINRIEATIPNRPNNRTVGNQE